MSDTGLLDNSVLTLLVKQEPNVTARLNAWLHAGNGVAIPHVALYEFCRGFSGGSVTREEMDFCETYIALYHIVAMDEATWRTAAEIWGALPPISKLRKKDGDILIAAAAIRGVFVVLTHNGRDFRTIQGVRQELRYEEW